MNIHDLYYTWNLRRYHELTDVLGYAFLLQQIDTTELTEEGYYKREQMLNEITNILEGAIK